MPRVKIIWTERVQLDEYDYKEVARHVEPGEFEEISDEELQHLRTNLHALPRPYYNFEPRILMYDPEILSTRMAVIRKAVARLEEARAVQEKKRKESAVKRKMTTLQRKRAQLAKLKAELEG